MDFKIREDNYNPLLKRKELRLEVDHDEAGTPSRMDLRKAIASKYGTQADNVYVMNMHTKTGTHGALCEVQVYDEPEQARRVVPKHIQIRNLPPEERKKAKEQKAKKERDKGEGAKQAPEKPGAEKTKEAKTKPAKDEKPKEDKAKAD